MKQKGLLPIILGIFVFQNSSCAEGTGEAHQISDTEAIQKFLDNEGDPHAAQIFTGRFEKQDEKLEFFNGELAAKLCIAGADAALIQKIMKMPGGLLTALVNFDEIFTAACAVKTGRKRVQEETLNTLDTHLPQPLTHLVIGYVGEAPWDETWKEINQHVINQRTVKRARTE
jgi:hypothetical protein